MTPQGHSINPDGLFHRSYVFQQFATKKPEDFKKAHEISSDRAYGFFAGSDDWNFTGGMFPQLTET